MYATFVFLIWCSCTQQGLMQTTSWDLVTSPPIVFGGQIELKCTVQGVATCCSAVSRLWNKGSSQIMSNGVASLPLKYSEKIDAANNQFSLVISSIDKNDVDVVYTCAYGNVPTPKTLTQNDSFEYHASGSCQMTVNDNFELVGTLNVAMSAPYPSVSAQFGGENYTSYLNTSIAVVTGSTKFYTIITSVKKKVTCSSKNRFTLIVHTGTKPTNICDDEEVCKGRQLDAGGINFGFSCIVPFVIIIIVIIVIGVVYYQIRHQADEDNQPHAGHIKLAMPAKPNASHSVKTVHSWRQLFDKSNKRGGCCMMLILSVPILIFLMVVFVLNFSIAFPIGYIKVNIQNGTGPAFVALGTTAALLLLVVSCIFKGDKGTVCDKETCCIWVLVLANYLKLINTEEDFAPSEEGENHNK